MRVGLTYDLRDDYIAEGYSEVETAEFDSAETIDALVAAIGSMGHEVVRIGNTKALVAALAAGKRWDLVFNICEGQQGFGRESTVPALLDAYGIGYTFSDPLVCALTLHKGMAKRVFRDCGLPTADFCVVETEVDIGEVALPFPLFVKPVAEGTGKGVDGLSRINDAEQLQTACRRLLRDYRQPVLVETWLPGREFTVGIVGSGEQARALGTLEIFVDVASESGIYSFHNKDNYESIVRYGLLEDEALAARVEKTALGAWRAVGCRDGGRIDIRLDENSVPNVIEINPLAGLHPVDSDLPILCRHLGISYRQLIAEIVGSALARLAGAQGEPNAAAQIRATG